MLTGVEGMTAGALRAALGTLSINRLQPPLVPALHPTGFEKVRIPR